MRKRYLILTLWALAAMLAACKHHMDADIPTKKVFVQEDITYPDNVRVISSSQSPNGSISFCTEGVWYWFDPAKNRKGAVGYYYSSFPSHLPAVNEAFMINYHPGVQVNDTLRNAYVHISDGSVNTGVFLNEDSIHAPNAFFSYGWNKEPFASLSPCRNLDEVNQANCYSCLPVVAPLKGYVYLSHIILDRILDSADARLRQLPEEGLQPLGPQPLTYMLSFWAAGKFYISGLHNLFLLDTNGTFTTIPLPNLSDEPKILYVKELGRDTVVALSLKNYCVYLSTNGGRTFPTQYEPHFLDGTKLFKVGSRTASVNGPDVYTFRWGQNIHLQKMSTEGMPTANIQGIYLNGNRVYCLTEAGVYSKDYMAFMSDTVKAN